MSNPTQRILPVPLLWPREERAAADTVAPEIQRVSDEQLIAGLKAGGHDSLAELFRRYSRLVFSIGLRIVRDPGEADEIVQDVFLYLFQKASLFDERKGAARAWLIQVAYHRALDRKEYLQRRNFYFGTNMELVTDTLTGTQDVEREYHSQYSRECLREAIQKLTDRQRLTLELFFFDGLDLREIAARLDESHENVRHHYYRGLQKLRKDVFLDRLKTNEP